MSHRNHEEEMEAHEELYSLLRERNTPDQASRIMDSMVVDEPGISATKMLERYLSRDRQRENEQGIGR